PGAGFTSRDVIVNPITFPYLPTNSDGSPKSYGKQSDGVSTADCIPSFAYGEQVITDFATAGNTTVNGNYGFVAVATDQYGNPTSGALPLGDYIVEPQLPPEQYTYAQPLYVPSMEEDVNNYSGPPVVPQAPPFPCAGPQ